MRQFLILLWVLLFGRQDELPDLLKQLQQQASEAPPAQKILTLSGETLSPDSEISSPHAAIRVSPNGRWFLIEDTGGYSFGVYNREGILGIADYIGDLVIHQQFRDPNTGALLSDVYTTFGPQTLNDTHCYIMVRTRTSTYDTNDRKTERHSYYMLRAYGLNDKLLNDETEKFTQQIHALFSSPSKHAPPRMISLGQDGVLYVVTDEGVWIVTRDSHRLLWSDFRSKHVFLTRDLLFVLDKRKPPLNVSIYQLSGTVEELEKCILRRMSLDLPTETKKITSKAVGIFLGDSNDIYVVYEIRSQFTPYLLIEKRVFGAEKLNVGY